MSKTAVLIVESDVEPGQLEAEGDTPENAILGSIDSGFDRDFSEGHDDDEVPPRDRSMSWLNTNLPDHSHDEGELRESSPPRIPIAAPPVKADTEHPAEKYAQEDTYTHISASDEYIAAEYPDVTETFVDKSASLENELSQSAVPTELYPGHHADYNSLSAQMYTSLPGGGIGEERGFARHANLITEVTDSAGSRRGLNYDTKNVKTDALGDEAARDLDMQVCECVCGCEIGGCGRGCGRMGGRT